MSDINRDWTKFSLCVIHPYYQRHKLKYLKPKISKSKMGIDGLLTLLKPLIKKQHISEFRGKTLGVDALPWIYKGIYGANIQMGQNINQNPNAFLYYIIEMVDMLEFYKIKPIFIFDGKSLDAKNKTLQKRKKAKEQQKKKAEQLLENNENEKANKTMARYINIDEAKLCLVMSLLKERNIEFVIAPYQADSQISKLFKLGIIEAVITEDSDLVVYGVDVILKLKETGQCDTLSIKRQKDDLQQCECPFVKKFCTFSQQKRVEAAILSGCDYVDSVKGIGIKKAIKLVEENDTLRKIVQSLKKDPKMSDKVPQSYFQLVQNAKLIFLFAKTFNPNEKKLQFLREDLLTEIETEQKLQAEVLQQIVGRDYEFQEEHYFGRVNCKTQEERVFQKISIKEIYSLNRENISFQRTQDKKEQNTMRDEARELIIDETTSICWEEDSVNEGLMFLLQKQIVGQFFTKEEPQCQEALVGTSEQKTQKLS